MRSASLLAFVVLVLLILLLLLRHTIVATSPVFIIIQCGAVALMIWARITFGRRSFHAAADPTEGGLVTKGPYRLIRHPIYSAILYFVWAGILSHVQIIDVLLALAITAAVVVRMLAEERLLLTRYPEYAEYARRVKRVIPFIL